MREDFSQVREMFLDEDGMTEPQCVFGLDSVQNLLAADRDRGEETEVMEFMAAEAGFHLLAIMPEKARELDIPFSLPVDGGLGVSSAKKAVARLSEANPYLTRMKKLSELLNSLPGEEIPFLKK